MSSNDQKELYIQITLDEIDIDVDVKILLTLTELAVIN
jgi:hypothetical protein